MINMQSYTFDELEATTQMTIWYRYQDEVNQLVKPYHRDATVQEARAELSTWRYTEHGERIA